MVNHRLYLIFLFPFHLQSFHKKPVLGWNLESSLHKWKLLNDPVSSGFTYFSSWLPMDPHRESVWLFLLTTFSAKTGFTLLKSTTWAVAFPTCKMPSVVLVSCVAKHRLWHCICFYSHLKKTLDAEEVMAERIFLGIQKLVKTFS